MTIHFADLTPFRSAIIRNSASATVIALFGRYFEWRKSQIVNSELVRRLDRMDAHQLQDIGLMRNARHVSWASTARGCPPSEILINTYEQLG